jgi:hypothetical protein
MEIQKKNQISVKSDFANKPKAVDGRNSESRGADHSSPVGWRLLLAALLSDGPRWRGGQGAAASTATAA